MAIFGKNKKIEKTPVVEEAKVDKKASRVKNPEAVKGGTKKAVKASSAKKTKSGKTPFHVAKRKGRRQTTKTNYMSDLSRVLVRPRITEKATDATASGTYVFEVAVDATKKDVFYAVEHYYKVKPVKVNLVKIPTKKRVNRRTRKVGLSSQGKKAYVFLKKGDTIEFV